LLRQSRSSNANQARQLDLTIGSSIELIWHQSDTSDGHEQVQGSAVSLLSMAQHDAPQKLHTAVHGFVCFVNDARIT
jgi:hypothetical protein